MGRRYLTPLVVLAAGASGVAYWKWSEPEDYTPGRRLVAVAISDSGRFIATGSAAGWISVWPVEAPDRTVQFRIGEQATPRALSFNPGEELLGVAHSQGLAEHGTTVIESPRLLRDSVGFHSLAFDAGREQWMAASDAGGVLWAGPGSCCATTGSAALSPDGLRILTSGEWPSVWDRNGRLVARLTAEREYSDFGPIAFDAVRNWILMGSRDGRIYAWDATSHEMRARSPEPAGAVETIAVIRGSPWIAFAMTGAPVHLWNPDTDEMRTIEALPTSNLVAGVEPGSLLVGNYAGSAQFWEVESGKMLRQRTLR